MSSYFTPFLRMARTCAPWVLAVVMCLSAFGMHEHLHAEPTCVASVDDHDDEGGCDLADCACPAPALVPEGTWPPMADHRGTPRHAVTDIVPPRNPGFCPDPPPAQRS